MIKCGPYRNFNNGWEPLTKEETEALNDNSLHKSLEQVRLINKEEDNKNDPGDDSVETKDS